MPLSAFSTMKIASDRICRATTLVMTKRSMQTERSDTMGDKGGKKDKNKGQKQKESKQEKEKKEKQDKQKKSTP
jgi:hypothetical protein